MIRPATDGDGLAPDVPERATSHQIPASPFNAHGPTSGSLKHQPLKSDVRGIPHRDHGLLKNGHEDLGALHRLRRPEVENPLLGIHVVFAGRVQLLQHIQEVEPLARAEAVVPVGGPGRDVSLLGVDRIDLLKGVGPVPAPVPVNPDVLEALPSLWTVSFVSEAGLQRPHLLAVPVLQVPLA